MAKRKNHKVDEVAKAIVNGKMVCGPNVRASAQRHLDDRDRDDDDIGRRSLD